MFTALLIGAAIAAPAVPAMKAAHRAARAADCAPALALSGLADAPPSKHRDRAAAAQVRCAAATLQPPDPLRFFAEPLSSAALVEPALRRELTTSVALSARAAVSRVSASAADLEAIHGLLSRARALDPTNWMLWEGSLQASSQRGDAVRVQADAIALLTAWSGEPSGAPIVSRFCSESDRDDEMIRADRDRGAKILEQCRVSLATAYAAHPQSIDVITAHLVVLEAAAYSTDAELRAAALDGLQRLAPDSVLVGLLEARTLSAAGDRAGARDRFAGVLAQAPEETEARFALGVLLAEDALAAYDAEPPVAAVDTARQAATHLEAAVQATDLRYEERIIAARLLIQVYDRLDDQAAEDRWRSTYTRLLGH